MIGLDSSQASSIRATAQEWGAPTVTAVHILNLQAHRERLGASWPACRRYLDTWVTSKAPNPELAMLIPTDNGYALVFRNAQEQAAFAMTRVLADAIDTVADAIPELPEYSLRKTLLMENGTDGFVNLPSAGKKAGT